MDKHQEDEGTGLSRKPHSQSDYIDRRWWLLIGSSWALYSILFQGTCTYCTYSSSTLYTVEWIMFYCLWKKKLCINVLHYLKIILVRTLHHFLPAFEVWMHTNQETSQDWRSAEISSQWIQRQLGSEPLFPLVGAGTGGFFQLLITYSWGRLEHGGRKGWRGVELS
jgi:hypothetical protein